MDTTTYGSIEADSVPISAALRFARRRVLLAEDDAPMRALLSSTLRGDGHDVLEAPSTRALRALLMLPARDSAGAICDPFDVIVTDNFMPCGMALDAIAELRAMGCATPVILITAYPDEMTLAKAAALEVRTLAKPFTLSAIPIL